ncbi:AMP-binding protein [Microbaculum marinisediminis]|uniref:AMP-binding protein n=1 Tax=Microbaculum marinisediminis TaxID=2931392 RepID=A0AAW5QV54_9HYPH|nr:AMP-binding protein [Microbaculum sp. A6E488]MCT8970538.1 AMP-binding protein [Microbaculum sp. A6E488]
MNVAAWLARAGRSFPNNPAVAVGTTIHQDYAALTDRASRLAAGLARLGLAPGDRVAIVARNGPHYVECMFGIWWGAFAAVPANAKLHGAELAWMLVNAGATVCFASAKEAETIAAHRPDGLKHLIEIGSPEYEGLFRDEGGPLSDAGPDALAWLFYTSGTTGRPKGAMITHRNIAAMTFGYLVDVDPTKPTDTILHSAPMSHGSGIYIMPHVCCAALNAVPESGGFEPDEIFRLIEARPGTSMFAAPTMIKRMVDHGGDVDPSGLRTLVWGGAPMYVEDVKKALDRFGPRLAQIFGQGESPMTGTVLSKAIIADRAHPRWLERIGSAGLANSACEVRVAGANDEPLAVGETGEVLIRGDCVVPGYWRNPEASAETLRNGWLHTGDVGAMDEDGFVTLKDRSKDMIISGGSNIYPREIEEVLLTHSGVREVSVIGRPDPDWGEIVVAYVVGEAGAPELDRLCLDSIARFKRPKDYVFVDALPKNNYGKILKTELRQQDDTRRKG